MNEIIKKATVIYKDGIEEQFDAIRIIDKGVIIGRFVNNAFESFGFIPKHNIHKIYNGNIIKKDW